MKYDLLSIGLEDGETLYFWRKNEYEMSKQDKEYLYEEKHCFTNIVRDFEGVALVKAGDIDTDPHGVFFYHETFDLEDPTEDELGAHLRDYLTKEL